MHMVVIDDEADDGSVLDARIELGLAPDSEALKQIPRHVARLWAGNAARLPGPVEDEDCQGTRMGRA